MDDSIAKLSISTIVATCSAVCACFLGWMRRRQQKLELKRIKLTLEATRDYILPEEENKSKWPTSPKKRSSVFVLCEPHNKSSNTVGKPIATAFAVLPEYILSASQNIPIMMLPWATENDVSAIRLECCDSYRATNPPSAMIPLELVAYNNQHGYDWAVFKRTDGLQFDEYLTICPEDELPKATDEDEVKIYYADFSSYEAEINCNVPIMYQSRLKVRSVIDCRMSVDVVLEGGSCGGPIVTWQGKVIAIHSVAVSDLAEIKSTYSHEEEMSEITMSSKSSEYRATHGCIICRLPCLMTALTSLKCN